MPIRRISDAHDEIDPENGNDAGDGSGSGSEIEPEARAAAPLRRLQRLISTPVAELYEETVARRFFTFGPSIYVIGMAGTRA